MNSRNTQALFSKYAGTIHDEIIYLLHCLSLLCKSLVNIEEARKERFIKTTYSPKRQVSEKCDILSKVMLRIQSFNVKAKFM